MSAPILRCSQLVVGWAGRGILPPLDLEVGAGQWWVVIGRNGAGKSTWMRTALGLARPISGRVEHPAGPPRMAYVPQRTALDDLYPLRVDQVVAMGLERGWSFLSARGRGKEVEEALDAVGATALAGSLYRSLSEGQKQRVLLARLVAARPTIAFLDEPTAAMDAVAEREALDHLDTIRRRYGTAVVVVTHSLAVVSDRADRVLLLDRDAELAVCGAPADILAHPVYVARYGGLT